MSQEDNSSSSARNHPTRATTTDSTACCLSDEEWRKLLKPAPTPEQVLQILESSYCDPATATGAASPSIQVLQQLDSYDDVNYMVKINETIYLLKIHNGLESRQFLTVCNEAGGRDYYQKGHMNSAIHLQNAIMQLLLASSSSSSDSHSGIVTSQPIPPFTSTPNASSSAAATVSSAASMPVSIHSLPVASPDHSPQALVVRLLSWVPGRTMYSIQSSLPVECLADAGCYLGKMDLVLDTFNTATTTTSTTAETANVVVVDDSLWIPARRFHAWDGKNTLGLRKFVHYISNERRRAMITSIIDTFEREILQSKVATQLRRGLNHGDYNDANILVDKHHDDDNNNDCWKVSGVLDFGDSVESWRVLEISTAMAYAMLSSYAKSHQASISAAAAMLRGYHSVYPLLPLERQHLVLLMTCRLACSATLGAYTFAQNPENTYLLLHSEPAWQALELIWCGDDACRRLQIKMAMNRVFDQACSYSKSTKDENDMIPCFDLAFPDPHVLDGLSAVRIVEASSTTTTEPVAKKPRTTIGHDDDDNSKRNSSNTNGNLPVVTFVTGNAKKLEEVKRILQTTNGDNASDDGTTTATAASPTSRLPIHLVNQSLDLPELQGEVLAIAREKCLVASQLVGGGAVIIEDTSLCFNALQGLPGPYIKWFLDSCGHDGLNRMLAGFDDKTAYAQTVVAYCPGRTNGDTTTNGDDVVIFSGRTNGTIVPARGKLDFGWDPIFEPFESVTAGDDGQNQKKTYAEMTKDEKDSISHRSRAFAQLRDYLARKYSDKK